MAEASLLRETEGRLFEGNLLRLEVEELLGEVRVDYGKKSVKALEVREWAGRMDGGGGECRCSIGLFPFRFVVIADNLVDWLRSCCRCEAAEACRCCFRKDARSPVSSSPPFSMCFQYIVPRLLCPCPVHVASLGKAAVIDEH